MSKPKTIKLHIPFLLDGVQKDEQMSARATELLSSKKISKDLFVVLVCGGKKDTENIQYYLIKFENKLYLRGFTEGIFASTYEMKDGGTLSRGFKFGKKIQQYYGECKKFRIWEHSEVDS